MLRCFHGVLGFQEHVIRQPCMPSTSGRTFQLFHPLKSQQRHSHSTHRIYAVNGNSRPFLNPKAADLPDKFDISKARHKLEKQLLVPEPPRNLWLAAVKPTMYTVAYIPIIVGGALAYYITGALVASHMLQLCLASTFIIAWLNTSNDGFDAFTGVDSNQRKPESLISLTGASPLAVLCAAFAMLAAGGFLLYRLLAPVGDPRVLAYLAAAVACGYLYQGPPFRLSYLGLGEPLCFVAFGPLATTAFFLAQAGSGIGEIPLVIWAASAIVGTTTAVILFCSHFHQIEGDMAAGKQSPLVRLGHQTAAEVLRLVCIWLYCSAAWLVNTAVFPTEALWLLALTLPSCLDMLMYAHFHHYTPALIRTLKFKAIRWHTAVGLALAGAFGLARVGGVQGFKVAIGF